ncbi:galanin-like G-protein coupled receptor npr-9 [Haliotis cracherodii]|uniref:galanin-like G-protein coupled receptor npr-9 n=1 Tax=Haliotis cracherodii TaxID=6455 RepID=UPI0039E7C255
MAQIGCYVVLFIALFSGAWPVKHNDPPQQLNEQSKDTSKVGINGPITNKNGTDNRSHEEFPDSPYAPLAATETTITMVIKYVGYVTVPTLLVVSLTGNCLTIIVMLSKTFWNSPCSPFLVALAISDSTYSMVIPFSNIFFRQLIGFDIRALTESGCHIFFIVHKASKIISSWFIVAISVERFIAVWFPLKANSICKRRNLLLFVLTIYLGVYIFTGVWTFSTKIINGVCVPNYATPDTAALARAYLVAGSMVFSLIPASILIILTPATCYKLFKQQAIRMELSVAHSNAGASNNRRASQTTVMLLGITIAYIILVTPTCIVHNICFSLKISLYETKDLTLSIARAVIQFTEQLNFSINFILYLLCNRSFRNRVLVILRHKTETQLTEGNNIQNPVTRQSTTRY